jgi:hypothetical protein
MIISTSTPAVIIAQSTHVVGQLMPFCRRVLPVMVEKHSGITDALTELAYWFD